MEICLALASDRRYFPGVCLTLASALRRSRAEHTYRVWVFHDGYREAEKKRLRRLAGKIKRRLELTFVAIGQGRFAALNPQRNGSYLAYAPFLFAETIPAQRLIFYDCDIIVLHPLEKLATLDLEGNLLAGCVDRWMPTLADDCPWPLSAAEEKLPYLNTGLLVIDLEKWREEDVTGQFWQLAQGDCPHLRYHDQTLLNYFARQQIKVLPEGWNGLLWSEDDLVRFAAKPEKLPNLHLVTQPKPWKEARLSFGAEIWWQAFSACFGRTELVAQRGRQICQDRQILRDELLSWWTRLFLAQRPKTGTAENADATTDPSEPRRQYVAQRRRSIERNQAALAVINRQLRRQLGTE